MGHLASITDCAMRVYICLARSQKALKHSLLVAVPATYCRALYMKKWWQLLRLLQ